MRPGEIPAQGRIIPDIPVFERLGGGMVVVLGNVVIGVREFFGSSLMAAGRRMLGIKPAPYQTVRPHLSH